LSNFEGNWKDYDSAIEEALCSSSSMDEDAGEGDDDAASNKDKDRDKERRRRWREREEQEAEDTSDSEYSGVEDAKFATSSDEYEFGNGEEERLENVNELNVSATSKTNFITKSNIPSAGNASTTDSRLSKMLPVSSSISTSASASASASASVSASISTPTSISTPKKKSKKTKKSKAAKDKKALLKSKKKKAKTDSTIATANACKGNGKNQFREILDQMMGIQRNPSGQIIYQAPPPTNILMEYSKQHSYFQSLQATLAAQAIKKSQDGNSPDTQGIDLTKTPPNNNSSAPKTSKIQNVHLYGYY
ncbi:hypothetical protein RFI_10553, partial [Reticulomyxa filosa]